MTSMCMCKRAAADAADNQQAAKNEPTEDLLGTNRPEVLCLWFIYLNVCGFIVPDVYW